MDLQLGRLYGQFAGYFREGLDFLNERNERQYMGRYDYLGNTIAIPFKNEAEYAKHISHSPGTPVRLLSFLVPNKRGKLSSVIQNLMYENQPGFKPFSDDELYQGYRFVGHLFVSNKESGISKRTSEIFRYVTIALIGGSYKFSFSDDEKTFNMFPEPPRGIVTLEGKVDAEIKPVQDDKGRWEQILENNLVLENVREYQLVQPKPERPKQAA